MTELGVQAQDADDEQDEQNVRLGDFAEPALAGGHGHLLARGPFQRQCHAVAVKERNGAAIEPGQQVVRVCGNQVNQLAVQRFLFAECLGFCDCLLCQLDIAAAPGGNAADVGGGIIGGLAAKRFVDVYGRAANHKNRRRSTCGGARGHGRYVGRKKNEEARRSSARPGRGHIDDDRHRRADDALDNAAHGVVQPAGRIQRDEDQAGAAARGFVNAADDELGRKRHDGAIDAHLDDQRGCGRRDCGGLRCLWVGRGSKWHQQEQGAKRAAQKQPARDGDGSLHHSTSIVAKREEVSADATKFRAALEEQWKSCQPIAGSRGRAGPGGRQRRPGQWQPR